MSKKTTWTDQELLDDMHNLVDAIACLTRLDSNHHDRHAFTIDGLIAQWYRLSLIADARNFTTYPRP